MRQIKQGLTFDDVLLVPQYSVVESREYVTTQSKIGYIPLSIPVISSNMDTVTWISMAKAMYEAGGLGILHRFAPVEEILGAIVELRLLNVPFSHIVPSIGIKPQDHEFVNRLYGLGINSVCIDVAHGDQKMTNEMVKYCKSVGFSTIIAGNVATLGAARRLEDSGANVIKVGVGPGSVCTTRIVTGHGYPQLSAILEIADNVDADVIADGGIKTSGDIVKALAAGADAVMLGYMLAGCEETPGYQPGTKIYRGSASKGANGNQKYIEGVDTVVRSNGPVSKVIAEIDAGLRSGMSYSGAYTIRELRMAAEFIQITNATQIENGPHGRMK